MKNKKIHTLLFTPVLISPFFFTISCVGSETNKNNLQLEETKTLDEAFKKNNNLIISKNLSNTSIKNFIKLSGWTDFDQFISDQFLSKYFLLSEEFKTLLKSNDFQIYKRIRQVTIQPIQQSNDLTIIFHLGNLLNDANIVSIKITNALSSPFIYDNLINISKKEVANLYPNKTDFDNEWTKISDPKNVNEQVFKKILNEAFNINETDLNKIMNAYKNDKIKLQKNNLYELIIELKQIAINEGFIFSFNQQTNTLGFDVFIKSYSLIKQ